MFQSTSFNFSFQDTTTISSTTYSNYHKIEENFTTSSKSQQKSCKIVLPSNYIHTQQWTCRAQQYLLDPYWTRPYSQTFSGNPRKQLWLQDKHEIVCSSQKLLMLATQLKSSYTESQIGLEFNSRFHITSWKMTFTRAKKASVKFGWFARPLITKLDWY